MHDSGYFKLQERFHIRGKRHCHLQAESNRKNRISFDQEILKPQKPLTLDHRGTQAYHPSALP